MNAVPLGRLEAVAPREVLTHEGRDFTSWLLEHDDHLAEALGIELELTAAEHPVGPYALDLLGRDLTHDAVLIVENQLEPTDHGHLGQLLTYAAGTAAATIVWICTRMKEEHRQALDEFYLRFWTRYLERVQAEGPSWTRAPKPQTASWMNQPSSVLGAVIGVSFAAGGRLRHELYIDSEDGERNTETFDRLVAHRTLLEEQYGSPLEFEPLPERRACRIGEYRDDGDVTDTERHDEFIDWFFDAGARLRVALAALPAEWDTTASASGEA